MFKRFITVVIAGVGFIALAMWAAGCNSSGTPVVLVVPLGFRGEFRVVKDSVHGVELVKEDGEWVFVIPPSGELKVRNDRPFYPWHAERARDSFGSKVEVETLGVSAGSGGGRNGMFSTEYDGTTHHWRVK